MNILLLTIASGIATRAFRCPAGFDERIEALRKKVGVPGMAISTVQNVKFLAKGYRVKKLGSSDYYWNLPFRPITATK
jgi:hypothetical protein